MRRVRRRHGTCQRLLLRPGGASPPWPPQGVQLVRGDSTIRRAGRHVLDGAAAVVGSSARRLVSRTG